ncbi:MAG: sigma-70 family RNA polymerase sigma factor [Bacteroidota bacterium]|nr:MAG: sigma-70 family RNA polymerase sigma factor [Bacteroidota bacterium]
MDIAYIKKVLEGDVDAFRYFVNKYQDMAYSLANSICKSEFLAEEATQEAFVKAFQNLDKFKQKSSFTTWFYKILVNESLRKIKRKRLEVLPNEDSLPEDINPEVKNSLDALHQMEQKEIIQNILQRMPESESLLLRLYYLSEKQVEEIREITGLSLSNIKVSLHRARKRFYFLLERSYKNEMYSIL